MTSMIGLFEKVSVGFLGIALLVALVIIVAALSMTADPVVNVQALPFGL